MQHGIRRHQLSEEARKAKLAKDQIKIRNYRGLSAEVLGDKKQKVWSKGELEKTERLLGLNPEFYSVWNYRRDILTQLFALKEGQGGVDKKSTLGNELLFVMAQLKMFPKCYWIWNHRIWSLLQLEAVGAANWKYELAMVEKLLDMDSRNFHGWEYRRFVIKNIEQSSLGKIDLSEQQKRLSEFVKINVQEYQFTTAKINKNISNFSAWHNRSKIIVKLYSALHKLEDKTPFQDTAAIFESPYHILVHELEYIKTGLFMDPDDSSVWLFLRWLLTDEFFVSELKRTDIQTRPTYQEILHQQLTLVEELNELEKDDNEHGLDNGWCIKTMVLIKACLSKETADFDQNSTNEIIALLQKLVSLDPLRKRRYLDLIEGIVPILELT